MKDSASSKPKKTTASRIRICLHHFMLFWCAFWSVVIVALVLGEVQARAERIDHIRPTSFSDGVTEDIVVTKKPIHSLIIPKEPPHVSIAQ